ncbi:MAG: hypothetical protein IT366_03290 [Candidatus Hydrogenedentes bacterium]|nr:hypothetical protein [Candidatus Hydrogenedentota bacterium]
MGSIDDRQKVSKDIAAPFRFLSRRRFLKLGVSFVGIAAGSVGGLLALRGQAPTVSGLSILTAHEYRTLQGIARAHLPRGGAFEMGAGDFDLARSFDRFLLGETAENVRGLKLALALVEYGPLIYERRLKTFSNLSESGRERHWESWVYSGAIVRRQVAAAFRKFLSMTFYDNEAVWKEIGYGGPAFKGPVS